MSAYTNADWASNKDNRKLTSAVLVIIYGAPVILKSKMQQSVVYAQHKQNTWPYYYVYRKCYGKRVCSRKCECISSMQYRYTRIFRVRYPLRRTTLIKVELSTWTSGTILYVIK